MRSASPELPRRQSDDPSVANPIADWLHGEKTEAIGRRSSIGAAEMQSADTGGAGALQSDVGRLAAGCISRLGVSLPPQLAQPAVGNCAVLMSARVVF